METFQKYLLIFFLLLVFFLAIYFTKKYTKSQTDSNVKTSYVWQVGDSSGPCSVPCGGGYQYANAYCAAVDSTGKILEQVNNSLCVSNIGPEPVYKVPCNTQDCVWNTGDWSSCSVPCGGGNQTRTVTCSGGVDSACKTAKPDISQTCNTQSCDWQYGPWSSCSVSCGVDGVQTRSYTCPVEGTCSGTPVSSQPCSPAPPLCEWTYSPWSTCPVPCGKGTQTRTATCPRQDANCGPEGPLSQPCTSENTCSWEQGSIYPYPPYSQEQLDNMATASGGNCSNTQNLVSLLQRDNQYVGLQFDSSVNRYVVGTPDKVAMSQNGAGNPIYIIPCPYGPISLASSSTAGTYFVTTHDHGGTTPLAWKMGSSDIIIGTMSSSNVFRAGSMYIDSTSGYVMYSDSGVETPAMFVPM